MNFLFPNFLFALAALSVPIALHLFDLQRPKKVLFTNVALLKNINERTSSSRKLRHLLVLISRLLFVSFLILAFAQPYFNDDSKEISNGNQAIAMYLDNSPSMQNQENNEVLINKALNSINSFIELLPPSVQYMYTDNFSQPKDKLWLTPEKLKDRITETKISNTIKNYDQIYQKQFYALNETGKSKQKKMIWFSDFQKSTSGDLFRIKPDSNIQLYIVPFQNKKSTNIYIDSIWLENLFVQQNTSNELRLKVVNSGNLKAPNIHLRLYIDDVQAASSSIELEPNSTGIASFNFTPSDKFLSKCRIEFEDEPINFDNKYYFTLSFTQSINILEVTDGKTEFIKKLYSNESAFKYKENKFGNLSLYDLKEADLVIVNGIDKLSEYEIKSIIESYKPGKNLMFFPSSEFQKKQNYFSNSLQAFGFTLNTVVSSANKQNIALPDTKNPFFENVFEKTDKNIDMPLVSSVWNWGNKGQILLKTRNEEPFLTLLEQSGKHLYLCSTPLSDDFSNFQRHSIFVPVMYKIAIKSAKQNNKLSYSFNSKNIEISTFGSKPKIKLQNGNFSYIPTQKLISGSMFFDMPAVPMDPGYYDVYQNDSMITSIAVNIEKAESIMDFYTYGDLKKGFADKKNVTVYENSNSYNYIDAYSDKYIGTPLWKYCIMLSLLFLLAEIVLIRFVKN
ncbi:MAG: BatA domain-containing protein [Bacteroidota bacterium]|nr:BatA domain-containing protein [Bacteroidota bacterium]